VIALRHLVRPVLRAALAAWLLGAAAAGAAAREMRPEISRAEAEWLAGVHSALNHRDCPRAVSRLNDGLEKRYPDAYMMAGAMYEMGLCVKAQWDRAATMYQRALAARHRGGQYRLVAGLAERDAPVALWWAQEGDAVMLPSECRVPAAAHRDAEAFAAALQAWPAGRLAACAYVAGVVAAVSGEVEYPGDALGMQIEGRIQMQFHPAQGRIDWRTAEIGRLALTGPVSGDREMDRSSAKASDALRRYLEEIGRRALARFKAPAGIDPDTVVKVEYVFTIR
jgi:TPR repeat protein